MWIYILIDLYYYCSFIMWEIHYKLAIKTTFDSVEVYNSGLNLIISINIAHISLFLVFILLISMNLIINNYNYFKKYVEIILYSFQRIPDNPIKEE